MHAKKTKQLDSWNTISHSALARVLYRILFLFLPWKAFEYIFYANYIRPADGQLCLNSNMCYIYVHVCVSLYSVVVLYSTLLLLFRSL